MAQAYNRPQDSQTPPDVKIRAIATSTLLLCDNRPLHQDSITVRLCYTLVVKQMEKASFCPLKITHMISSSFFSEDVSFLSVWIMCYSEV